MKKIITLLTSSVLLVFSTFNANALEMPNITLPSLSGLAVGVAGSAGIYKASGTETEDDEIQTSDNQTLAIGYGSVFVEYSIEAAKGLTLGVDYVFDDIATETQDREDFNTESVNDAGIGSTSGLTNLQSAKANFSDLTTYYVELPLAITGLDTGAYIKFGLREVDVETRESLATGSTYNNTSIDGELYAIGTKRTFDDYGLFVKFEASYTEWDKIKLTSNTNADNVITADLEGAVATIAIGKSF
jgi:hypothetical protein